jgi:DNA-binding MarR family transcriptional regulator
MTLRDGAVQTAADLARYMNHDSGSTTRLLDQLEKKGRIKRVRSHEDRRKIVLTLTPNGATIAAEKTRLVIDYWNRVLGPLSETEFDTMVGLFVKLAQLVGDEAMK